MYAIFQELILCFASFNFEMTADLCGIYETKTLFFIMVFACFSNDIIANHQFTPEVTAEIPAPKY